MTVLRNFLVDWDVRISNQQQIWGFERLLGRLQQSFVAMGAAGALAFWSITKPAMDFEDQLLRVMSLTDATGSQFDKLKRQTAELAFEVSQKFGIDATEALDDFFNVINTGVPAGTEQFAEMVDVLEKLKLVAGVTSLEGARVLAKAMTAFPGETPESIGSKLFTASKMAPQFVGEIAKAMEKAGPAARLFGFNLNETLATLSVFSTMAQSGPQAGTRFRSGLLKLQASAGQTTKGLKLLGLTAHDVFVDAKNGNAVFRNLGEVFDLLRTRMRAIGPVGMRVALTQIFGRRIAEAYISVLMQNNKVLVDFEKRLKASGGQLSRGYIMRMEAALRKTMQLGQVIKILLIKLGLPWNEVLKNATDKMREFVNVIISFLDAHPRLKAAIGIFVGLSSSVMTLAGALGIAAAAFTLLQLAAIRLGMTATAVFLRLFIWPIVMAVLVFILIGAVEDLVGTFTGMDSLLGELWKKNKLLALSVGFLTATVAIFAAAWLAVLSPVLAVLIILGFIVAVAISLNKHWDEVSSTTRAWAVVFKKDLEGIVLKIRSFLTEFPHGIVWAMMFGKGDAWTRLKRFFNTSWGKITTGIAENWFNPAPEGAPRFNPWQVGFDRQPPALGPGDHIEINQVLSFQAFDDESSGDQAATALGKGAKKAIIEVEKAKKKPTTIKKVGEQTAATGVP